MIKSLIILIIFTVSLTSCCTLTFEEKAQRNVVNIFSREAKKKLEITLFSIETNTYLKAKNEVEIVFYSYHKVDVETARKLLVRSVEGFITFANDFAKLNGNLAQLKFNSQNIKFSILFIKNDGNFVNDHLIADVSLDDGIVYYATNESEDCPLEYLFGESYQKALGIVQHQQDLENLSNLNVHF